VGALNGAVANVNANYTNEPPEAQSIRSMLHIARILAIIFGILLLLGGIAYAALVAYYFSICSTFVGFDGYCGASLGVLLIWPILIIVWGVVDFLIYVNLKSIEAMVNGHQYEQAKNKTLIWMILGFILGGILIGIILLIAYIKFDPLINASRQQAQMGGGGYPPQGYPPQGYAQPGYPAPGAPPAYPPQGAPPAYPPPQAAPAYAAPVPMQAPPAPVAAAPAAAPFCSKCGKPTTYIAQYGRYYCYDDKIYV
jgi:hypothetical protein